MRFIEFKCRYCGRKLPAEVREDTGGMVRIWCEKCQRYTYILNRKVVIMK